MSISYHAHVFYGYSLPKSDLIQRTPNPLWGKVRFNPDTGTKVTEFVVTEIDLGLESGDKHPKMTRFTRFDTGHSDDDSIILGVAVAKMDLSYGSRDPQRITRLDEEDENEVGEMVIRLLVKAGTPFNVAQMGYWLGGQTL